MLFSCKPMLSSRSRGKTNRSPLWSLGKFSTMCCWLPFNRKRNSIKSLMAIENLVVSHLSNARPSILQTILGAGHIRKTWDFIRTLRHSLESHCSVARALAYSQEGHYPQGKDLVQASGKKKTNWNETCWKFFGLQLWGTELHQAKTSAQ